jgi:hypothetical protein
MMMTKEPVMMIRWRPAGVRNGPIWKVSRRVFPGATELDDGHV